MSKIIADNNNKDIYNFVCQKLKMKVASTITLGVLDKDGKLNCGICYYKKGFICLITAFALNASWCRPYILSELFRVPFVMLKCKIAKLEVSHKNNRANRFCKGIGCVKEGLLRYERADQTHNIIWSLTYKELIKKGWYKK